MMPKQLKSFYVMESFPIPWYLFTLVSALEDLSSRECALDYLGEMISTSIKMEKNLPGESIAAMIKANFLRELGKDLEEATILSCYDDKKIEEGLTFLLYYFHHRIDEILETLKQRQMNKPTFFMVNLQEPDTVWFEFFIESKE